MTKEELSKVMEVEFDTWMKMVIRVTNYPNTDSTFKAGFRICQSILLPEIERLKEFNEGAEKINREGIALISNLEDNLHTLKEENQRLRDALESMPSTFDALAKSLRNGSRSEEHNIWAHDTCLIVKSFIDR